MNCFVYGTLMAEEVLRVLIKRVPDQIPARVTGFRRHALKKQVFPATVPATKSDVVVGKVLSGLTEREMAVFDAFEGEEYYKQGVTAELLTSTDENEPETVDTFLYCWSDSLRSELLSEEWSYDRFREENLEKYVEMCRGFEQELNGSGGEDETASAAARSW